MAFRFPSVSAVIKGTLDTLKRFPLPLLSAIIGSGICIYMLELKWDVQKDFEHLWKMVMCCGLGLNLFLSMSLISERRNHGAVQKYLAQFAGLLLLVGYYFLLPEFRRMTVTDGARYSLFSTGLHLLVAFSPFIARGEINGFWQFNKTLFLRFLLSVLYSGVLYLGLALALLAVDQLFNADIKGERYGQLWFFLSGVFNTWFFLAGVPKNLNELESVTDYPKGLKIFTQFILLPLLAVYLLILYAYGIKIIIQWELPKGWVSWLVNAFSVFGILSLLLIYPVRNDEGNTWIKIFSRWFYRALFPLIVLLGVAIGKRVMQYGITENRYFVLIVALWLAGIATYFLLSKTKNIKVIPVTLFFIAFLSSFGPWGAFSVSEKSQVNRLEKLLIEEKILVDGKIKKTTDTISDKKGRQIVSIVHYLDEHHHFDAIKSWFKENLDSILAPKDSNDYVYETGKILALMGLEDNYYYGYRDDERDEDDTATIKNFYYYARNESQQAVSVAGFDYSCNFNRSFYEGDNSYYNDSYYKIYFGKDSGIIKYSKESTDFVFVKNGKDILRFDLNAYVKKIASYNKEHKKHQYDQNIPNEMTLFEAKNDSVKMKLYMTNISGTKSKQEIKITQISGMMLLKLGSSQSDTIHAGIK
ncbi:MAG: DUF4153 domain-containing protein [Bacteroidetes bacterium]|nr:DUF4153 domain-containing protein [Bacteroidota bacterium]